MNIEQLKRVRVMMANVPLFARYLFVYLDNSGHGRSWSPIRSTLGVSSLVEFGGNAAKVDDAMTDMLRQQVNSQHDEALLEQGDTVLLTPGPLKGLEAVYQTTNAAPRALILLEILNRPLQVQIEPACLCKVD